MPGSSTTLSGPDEPLRATARGLGADVVSALHLSDLHPLLVAGLPARCSRFGLPRLERHDGCLVSPQVLELDRTVRVPELQEPRGLKRDVLAVAIRVRNAVYGNLVLRLVPSFRLTLQAGEAGRRASPRPG